MSDNQPFKKALTENCWLPVTCNGECIGKCYVDYITFWKEITDMATKCSITKEEVQSAIDLLKPTKKAKRKCEEFGIDVR